MLFIMLFRQRSQQSRRIGQWSRQVQIYQRSCNCLRGSECHLSGERVIGSCWRLAGRVRCRRCAPTGAARHGWRGGPGVGRRQVRAHCNLALTLERGPPDRPTLCSGNSVVSTLQDEIGTKRSVNANVSCQSPQKKILWSTMRCNGHVSLGGTRAVQLKYANRSSLDRRNVPPNITCTTLSMNSYMCMYYRTYLEGETSALCGLRDFRGSQAQPVS